jgi:CheY-like chemotaxis protein
MEALAPLVILLVEDDLGDQKLIKLSLRNEKIANDLYTVQSGEEGMDFLHHRGKYNDGTPQPDLILLDLNMPRKDGREALAEIKNDPLLRYIPVVVLTTSKAEEDIMRSYDIGAASYITKPVTFDGLVEAIRGLGQYWVQIVRLPVKEKV